MGPKLKIYVDQIHSVLLQSDCQKKDQSSDLNKSLECFMADTSREACNINSVETPRLYTSLLQVSNLSCLNSKDIDDESSSNPIISFQSTDMPTQCKFEKKLPIVKSLFVSKGKNLQSQSCICKSLAFNVIIRP